MPPNASLAQPERHPSASPPQAARPARLQPVIGGYDIRHWPIHVPRADGESLLGWLRRLAYRYGITAGAVLDEIGAPARRDTRPDLAAMIDADPAGFARAGLEKDQGRMRTSTRSITLDRLDADYWADIRRRRTRRWSPASRYCPACLTNTGTWLDTWQHPYHLACTRHDLLLQHSCPGCDAQPFAKPTWLTYEGRPTACHDFAARADGTRYRQRCNTDLRGAPTTQAHPDLVAAQKWLWQVLDAAAAGEPLTVIGIPVDAATVYEAAAEIITENTYPAMADGQPRFPEEPALPLAHVLLTQPTVAEAAALAPRVRGFDPQAGAAPIGPLHWVRHRPRNPLIAAISLQQHQGRLTVGAELKFRVGTPAPSYPHAWGVRTKALTPSTSLPDLPMSMIPAAVWSGSFTLGDPELDNAHRIDTTLGRAFAALAVAHFASTRGWRLLAVNLGLPARCATTGARHWHTLDRAGLWPVYVRAIAGLYEHLHAGPPPIDYEHRRLTAQPGRVLAEARRTVAEHPDLGVGRSRFARALWAAYTGGDPTFAPLPLNGPPIEWPHSWEPALTTAAERLGKPRHEPLSWHPP